MRLSVLGVLIGCLILSACVAPYNDARREAGQRAPVGQSQGNTIAICYHPWRDEMPTVQQAAQDICTQSGKTAVLQSVKHFSCTIAAPETAFFKCE